MLILAALIIAQANVTPPGEDPVAPYVERDANAGTRPFRGDAMLRAFHGRAGIARIVEDLVARIEVDPRLAEILVAQDKVRLRRLLKEQFCYVLNGGCRYSGRTMRDGHRNLGLQTADVSALIEDLQAAMRTERVPFFAQNRFLGRLAPLKRDIVER